MRIFPLQLVAVMASLMIGCSKSNSSPGGGKAATFPFGNGDYVGVFTELSREYQKPMLLHFGADSSVTAYAVFYLSVNGQPYLQDSLEGKVVRVGTGNNGNPAVTLYMAATADTQVWTFSPDYSSVNGGSNGLASNQFYATALKRAPGKPESLEKTFWTTDSSKVIANDGYYPDIDGTTFLTGGMTNYTQNGSLLNTGPEGIPPNQTIIFSYVQTGAMVNFYGAGINPNYNIIPIKYFGVISLDGNTITADTRDPNARLPLLGQVADSYGDPGNPPTMHKHS